MPAPRLCGGGALAESDDELAPRARACDVGEAALLLEVLHVLHRVWLEPGEERQRALLQMAGKDKVPLHALCLVDRRDNHGRGVARGSGLPLPLPGGRHRVVQRQVHVIDEFLETLEGGHDAARASPAPGRRGGAADLLGGAEEARELQTDGAARA